MYNREHDSCGQDYIAHMCHIKPLRGFESPIINSTSVYSVERFHKACAIQ